MRGKWKTGESGVKKGKGKGDCVGRREEGLRVWIILKQLSVKHNINKAVWPQDFIKRQPWRLRATRKSDKNLRFVVIDDERFGFDKGQFVRLYDSVFTVKSKYDARANRISRQNASLHGFIDIRQPFEDEQRGTNGQFAFKRVGRQSRIVVVVVVVAVGSIVIVVAFVVLKKETENV